MIDDQDGCEWVDASSRSSDAYLGSPGQRAVKRLCVYQFVSENKSVVSFLCWLST